MKTKLITFLIGLAAQVSVRAQDFKLPTAEPVEVITVTTQRVQSAELTLRVFTVRPDLGVIVGQADYGPGTRAFPITITNAALATKLRAALVKEVKPQVEMGIARHIQLTKEREAQAVKQRAEYAAKQRGEAAAKRWARDLQKVAPIGLPKTNVVEGATSASPPRTNAFSPAVLEAARRRALEAGITNVSAAPNP